MPHMVLQHNQVRYAWRTCPGREARAAIHLSVSAHMLALPRLKGSTRHPVHRAALLLAISVRLPTGHVARGHCASKLMPSAGRAAVEC
eukprot:scaffold3418_cov124-Isochrysis_galbana.AAC.32